jgi:hypothetical protein
LDECQNPKDQCKGRIKWIGKIICFYWVLDSSKFQDSGLVMLIINATLGSTTMGAIFITPTSKA